MLERFSFQGLAKEQKKEKRKMLDFSQLMLTDPKKPIGLSQEIVDYMITVGKL